MYCQILQPWRKITIQNQYSSTLLCYTRIYGEATVETQLGGVFGSLIVQYPGQPATARVENCYVYLSNSFKYRVAQHNSEGQGIGYEEIDDFPDFYFNGSEPGNAITDCYIVSTVDSENFQAVRVMSDSALIDSVKDNPNWNTTRVWNTEGSYLELR